MHKYTQNERTQTTNLTNVRPRSLCTRNADMASPSPLPPVRRVVTEHTATGQSTVVLDSTLEAYSPRPGSKSQFADAFWAETAPYDSNAAVVDRPQDASMLAPSGSGLLVVDSPPGGKTVREQSMCTRA